MNIWGLFVHFLSSLQKTKLEVVNLDGVNIDEANFDSRQTFYFHVCCEFPVKILCLFFIANLD